MLHFYSRPNSPQCDCQLNCCDVWINRRHDLLALLEFLPSHLVMAEIGVFAGNSTQAFLSSGKVDRYYAIDAWDHTHNFLYDLDLAENRFDSRFATDSRVVKIKSFSECAAKLVDCALDFVYIDGDHRYNAVKKDIHVWIAKLKDDGWLGGHDYPIPGVQQAVNELLPIVNTVYLMGHPSQVNWLCKINRNMRRRLLTAHKI